MGRSLGNGAGLLTDRHFEMVLAKHRSAVDAADSRSGTALMKAAKRGAKEAVTSLLRAGADPTIRDASGYDAMWWACLSGSSDCVEAILNEMIQRNQPMFPEPSQYVEAMAYGGSGDIATMLVAAFPNMNVTTLRRSAIIAASFGHLDALEVLCNAGVQLPENLSLWLWPQVAKLEGFEWVANGPVSSRSLPPTFRMPGERTTVNVADEYITRLQAVLGHTVDDPTVTATEVDDATASLRIAIKTQNQDALESLKGVWGARLASQKAFVRTSAMNQENFVAAVKRSIDMTVSLN